MGRYNKYQQKMEPKKGLHPIWRGIGCLIMVLVPLISYGLTVLLVPVLKNNNVIPPEIEGYINFPEWVFKVPLLSQLCTWIHSVPDMWPKLIVFVVFVILLAAVGSLIYTSIAQVVGPPRYTELDVPAKPFHGKAYKR